MFDRILTKYLKRDAGYYPVVTLTGPRQSGKSTLVRSTFPDSEHVSLEETENRRFAQEDPKGFLARYAGPVIIDEVQRSPDILSCIQTDVDRDGTAGRFVLTGSQDFLLMEKVSQTLAGRCAVMNLLPLSRAELEGQPQKESGKTVSSDMWETLSWWCALSGRPVNSAVLVYGGDDAYVRNGIAIRPWFAI